MGKPTPVTVLDANLNVIGSLRPCPAEAHGPFLGANVVGELEGRQIVLHCAELEGHDGPHYFHVEWTDPVSNPEEGDR